MKDIELILFITLIIITIIALTLFVVFGQVTVRKLRKIPEIKNNLGMEFIGGWDIFNVAQALAIPYRLAKKLKSSPLSGLHADIDQLKKHTTKTDRILAFAFIGYLYYPDYRAYCWSAPAILVHSNNI